MAPQKKTKPPAPLHFESTVTQLEALLQKLEDNEISLEDALQAFEQGIHLAGEAQTALAAAEQRVRTLIEKNSEAVGEEFSLDEQNQ